MSAGKLTLLDAETIAEWGDVQHVEKRGLGWSDLVLLLDQMDIVQDFNASTGDLGGDLQSLEEGGLLGTESGGTLRDDDIQGSDGTSLGGGFDLNNNDRDRHKKRLTSIQKRNFKNTTISSNYCHSFKGRKVNIKRFLLTSYLVGQNLGADIGKISLAEHESDVLLDVRQKPGVKNREKKIK